MLLKAYQCKHFKIQELVPEAVFYAFGDQSWRFLDARALYTIDCVREYFDVPMICNTWNHGGTHQYRGFRPPDCSVGARFSGHKRGQAVDLLPKSGDVTKMRLKIVENNLMFPYLTLIEDKVNWLHLSVENILSTGASIKIINP